MGTVGSSPSHGPRIGEHDASRRSVPYLADRASSLESFVADVDAGLASSRRTANEQTIRCLDSYRWLADVLRGDAAAGDRVPLVEVADDPLPLLSAHLCHATAAAIFGDQTGLLRHTAAAMPLLPLGGGAVSTATVRMLRGLALAERARGDDGAERLALLAELDELSGLLAARSADPPEDVLHLLRLLDAERAWTVGDFRAAAQAFDAARREVAHRQRPWHRALITERAARFHLAHGLEQAGRDLLTQARHEYAAWGATAKVAQLDRAHPTGTLDLLDVLSASRALSAETSVERLNARVVDLLSAMTGATGVHLLLWNDDGGDWLLPAPGDGTATAGGHEVPMSVLHHVRRTGETLIVEDATRDDRFARDPYLAGLEGCALVAVPILGRGALRAVLLLENRLIRAAFTAQRLDAVRLITAQLAVSLDTAQRYADLVASRARIVTAADRARRRLERRLHDGAQQRLVTLAMRARMARTAAPSGSGASREALEALATEATTAMSELRELAHGLHPATLAENGLLPALKALARRSPVPVRLDAPAGRRLPEPIEVAAYYVVAEALTNAADASTVTVTVGTDTTPTGAVLRVRVHDDGRGGRSTGGSGLLELRDRVEALGGGLAVHSAPGTGTTVQAELPLPSGDAGPD
jgi:signal transduction histidine kinase